MTTNSNKGFKFKVDKEIQAKDIEWLERSPEIMEFLKNKGIKDIGELIDRQKEIPPKYLIEIKRKIIFGM